MLSCQRNDRLDEEIVLQTISYYWGVGGVRKNRIIVTSRHK